MPTWIRSQDKRAITNGEVTYYLQNSYDNSYISLVYPNNHECTLGKYETYDRGVEVFEFLWQALAYDHAITMPEK